MQKKNRVCPWLRSSPEPSVTTDSLTIPHPCHPVISFTIPGNELAKKERKIQKKQNGRQTHTHLDGWTDRKINETVNQKEKVERKREGDNTLPPVIFFVLGRVIELSLISVQTPEPKMIAFHIMKETVAAFF